MTPKFKAYIKAENRIVKVHDISYRFDTVGEKLELECIHIFKMDKLPFQKGKEYYHHSEIILLMGTGLIDKKGVEIFEGDQLIPYAYRNTIGGENWKDFICEVVFFEGMFCLKKQGKFIGSWKPLRDSLKGRIKAGNEFIIIGNIKEGV